MVADESFHICLKDVNIMWKLCKPGGERQRARAGGECAVCSQRPHPLPAHSHPASVQPSMRGYPYISVLSLISHHSFSIMYSTRHSSCLKELGVYWERKTRPQGSHTVLDAAWEVNSRGWEPWWASASPSVQNRKKPTASGSVSSQSNSCREGQMTPLVRSAIEWVIL